ncbi:methionine synthase [Lactobacillus pentosus]|jgi:methionine synthase II (cobalamin-independent)|uniref:methionine synthase n=1 Tax=Lactiplantibacillus pentosus TaxID=1589 RepID=UPI00128CB753|nr:methionine synthase [Lactiplantibacillus pentosus]MCH4129769.1 methionine synthase [Lactiplantibacillus sp.]BBM22615.1 methionine synthase (cobalamine-independent) family protein [Lactiplantibacillus plantarum]MCT0162383.1 methionine synthase [Lactiplantibacillus pentosus]MCT3294403.1 methionine synthase [Lactiplantibacillus pentosus]MPQ20247.1 methionine synthase [Lactiplantibacillus pentosus]
MEIGTLMAMVKRHVRQRQATVRRRGQLRRHITMSTISAAGFSKIEDAIFIEQLKKPINNAKICPNNWWHLNFFWELQGISRTSAAQVPALSLNGKISGINHPAVAHFEFMREQVSDGDADKQILPAPALCLAELKRPDNAVAVSRVYQSDTELVHDLASAYHQIMTDLYHAGARRIQLNNGHQSSDKITELSAQVSREAVQNLPADLCVNWHVAQGHYYSA